MPVVTAASNGPEGCSSTICTSLTNVYSTNDDDAASSPNGVSTSVIIAVAVVLSFLMLFIITAIAGCRAHNQKSSGDTQDVENTEEQSPLQATPAGIPSLENSHLPHHHIHHHHTHELANHSNLNNVATTISTSTAPPPYSP